MDVAYYVGSRAAKGRHGKACVWASRTQRIGVFMWCSSRGLATRFVVLPVGLVAAVLLQAAPVHGASASAPLKSASHYSVKGTTGQTLLVANTRVETGRDLSGFLIGHFVCNLRLASASGKAAPGSGLGITDKSAHKNRTAWVGYPDPPTAITATAGNESVTVTWTPATTGVEATYFYLQYSNDATHWSGVNWFPRSQTSETITGLTNGISYYYRVTAQDRSYCSNGISNSISTSMPAIPEPTSPAAPIGLTVAPGVAAGTVTVSWTNGPFNGDRLEYNVIEDSVDGVTWTVVHPVYPDGEVIIAGLIYGVAYHFRVTAFDFNGHPSVPDTFASTVTLRAPSNGGTGSHVHKPGSPSHVVAIAHGSRLRVSWRAPSSTGGAPIMRYKVSITPGKKSCFTKHLSCTISGLNPKKRYSVTISASNSAGSGSTVTLRKVTG